MDGWGFCGECVGIVLAASRAAASRNVRFVSERQPDGETNVRIVISPIGVRLTVTVRWHAPN